MPLTLTREIRFGLYELPETPAGAANGFAGNPRLEGIAPFLTLQARLAGSVDPSTGMLINIKVVDRVLRELAVPAIRRDHFAGTTAAQILPRLMRLLERKFDPHGLVSLKLLPSPHLWFLVTHKEPAMVRVCLRFEFSAAHRLHAAALSAQANLDVFGRCNNPSGHGHNYEIEVEVAGTPDAQGQVVRLQELQAAVNRHIIDSFDHKHLNLDCPEFGDDGLNPTVENIAQVLYGRLVPHVPSPARLTALRVWETPKTMCEFTG